MDIDPRRSLSRIQFCWVENISLAKYHDLQKKGLGPAVTDIDGVQRITPEARRRVAPAHGRARQERGCATGST